MIAWPSSDFIDPATGQNLQGSRQFPVVHAGEVKTVSYDWDTTGLAWSSGGNSTSIELPAAEPFGQGKRAIPRTDPEPVGIDQEFPG